MADIPVDIYFVLDFTGTMRKKQEQLQKSSGDIAQQIGQLTKDFRIGFGTFSEKPRIPFSQAAKSASKDHTPYAFHHQMDLKNDTTMFNDILAGKLQDMQENIDNPESGILQYRDSLVSAVSISRA